MYIALRQKCGTPAPEAVSVFPMAGPRSPAGLSRRLGSGAAANNPLTGCSADDQLARSPSGRTLVLTALARNFSCAETVSTNHTASPSVGVRAGPG